MRNAQSYCDLRHKRQNSFWDEYVPPTEVANGSVRGAYSLRAMIQDAQAKEILLWEERKFVPACRSVWKKTCCEVSAGLVQK
jgi:hypothetical protein